MKFTYIVTTFLLLSFLGTSLMADDDKKDEKKSYKLKVKHVEPNTTLVVECDNGFYKKEETKEDKDKVKFKIPEESTCTLDVTSDDPYYRHMREPLKIPFVLTIS